MNPIFEPTDDGLEIIDPIERHRYRLLTHDSVSLEPVDPTEIRYPVESAVEVSLDAISISVNTAICIRNKNTDMISEYDPSEQADLPRDEYTLDLSGSLKLYIQFESSVYIYSDTEQTHIALDESTSVVVGARSYHTQPAGTITTTGDPLDLMQAVSAFGSALKTTSAERSYPTLRGHPPVLELGSELEIPDEFDRPETGIQIAVPETYRHVFAATPLAYYLGAEIVSASVPKIRTSHGYTYRLAERRNYESTVERLLKHVFFLDCVVRTEGSTPLPLYERQEVESLLPFDIATVYAQPLAKRVETYLEVPLERIATHVPEWRLESQLEADERSIEFLPFVANNLATVRVREGEDESHAAPDRSQTQAIEAFTRSRCAESDLETRGRDETGAETSRETPYTIRQVWNASSSSKIANTAPLSSFYNGIGRKPKEDPIEIVVVCNDRTMREELETVNSVYGTREELPFDVAIHYDTTTVELRSILTDGCDFFHYIGHIDEDGFDCSDGKVDASTIRTVGIKAFLLNACQSYTQGLHLVEAGSMGGIATLDAVANSGAVTVGGTLASLLNQGFPLYAALDITRADSVSGAQYRIVGDGITTIAQSKTGAPAVCFLDESDDGVRITLAMYTSAGMKKGSLFSPHLEPVDSYYILPGETNPITATKTQLTDFFELEELPVIANGKLCWSSDIDFD